MSQVDELAARRENGRQAAEAGRRAEKLRRAGGVAEAPEAQVVTPEAFGEESADLRWADPRAPKEPLPVALLAKLPALFRARVADSVRPGRDREVLVQRALSAFKRRWAAHLSALSTALREPRRLGAACASARWEEDPSAKLPWSPELEASLTSAAEATLLEAGVPEARAVELLPEAREGARERWAELLREGYPALGPR